MPMFVNAHMLWSGSPRNSKDVCGDTSHAETEHGPRPWELLALPSVELIDVLICDGTSLIGLLIG